MSFQNWSYPSNLIPSDPRFGCGPSLLPMSYVQDLLETKNHYLGTSHRKKPVQNILEGIAEGLKSFFQCPEDRLVIVGNGGATTLFDLLSLTLCEKKALHFTCGEFSSKWAKASQNISDLSVKIESSEFGELPSLIIDEDYDLHCMTLNETSTGVQLDKVPDRDDYSGLIAMDATSGAGQIPVDMANIDVFFFSAQKVFASEGGTHVLILSPRAIERAIKLKEKKYRYVPLSMDLIPMIENARKFQTTNTPSLSSLFFLARQIEEMNKLGPEKVYAEARRKADLVYSWAEEKDYLYPYVERKDIRSLSVAAINVDERFPVKEFVSFLEEKKLVYGIDSYRKLGANQFRISLFHNIHYEDLEKLTRLLSLGIESHL